MIPTNSTERLRIKAVTVKIDKNRINQIATMTYARWSERIITTFRTGKNDGGESFTIQVAIYGREVGEEWQKWFYLTSGHVAAKLERIADSDWENVPGGKPKKANWTLKLTGLRLADIPQLLEFDFMKKPKMPSNLPKTTDFRKGDIVEIRWTYPNDLKSIGKRAVVTKVRTSLSDGLLELHEQGESSYKQQHLIQAMYVKLIYRPTPQEEEEVPEVKNNNVIDIGSKFKAGDKVKILQTRPNLPSLIGTSATITEVWKSFSALTIQSDNLGQSIVVQTSWVEAWVEEVSIAAA